MVDVLTAIDMMGSASGLRAGVARSSPAAVSTDTRQTSAQQRPVERHVSAVYSVLYVRDLIQYLDMRARRRQQL